MLSAESPESFSASTHPLATDNYLAFARRLKRIGLDNGIVCNQSHAPFPSDCAEIRSYLKRAIECTAEAGGQICIIHPANNRSAQKNAEMYLELLPFAKDCGVKIAAENMWNWDREKDESTFAACASTESFLEHLDAVNDDFLVACLDVGHAEMRGSGSGAVAMIRALNDNDRWHDSHQIPLSMSIDFDAVVSALKEIDYKGYFTLEADQYLSAYSEENIFEGICSLYASVRKLADMFEA